MEINEHLCAEATIIEQYSPNGIVILNQQYGNIAILNNQIIELNSGRLPENIDESVFQAALLSAPELLIVGTGLQRVALPPKVAVALYQKGIGVDVMNTAAACRTFNLLQSEGRNVAAWLWLN